MFGRKKKLLKYDEKKIKPEYSDILKVENLVHEFIDTDDDGNITEKIRAVDNVSLEVCPGDFISILGHNGSGKSTLAKHINAILMPLEGSVIVAGMDTLEEDYLWDIRQTAGMVFQNPDNQIIATVVEEDVAFGPENLGIEREEIVKRVDYALNAVDMIEYRKHSPNRLSGCQKQRVAIAGIVAMHPEVIVLDEPTDVLESTSRNDLFQVINLLKKEGVGFIYISHRYAEVYELGDRVTILRDGKNVGTFSIKDLTLETMIEKMIGGKIGKQYPSLPTPQEKIILRLENFHKGTAVQGVDFSLRKGEILGITGLMGAGKTELARAIAGVDPPISGNLYIEDKKVMVRTPKEAILHGISFLTENRKTEGLILDQSLRNNYGLPNINRLSPFGLVKIKKMNDEIDFYMKELTIKAPHRFTLAGQLSGGNQQKMVLAKWLGTHAKVIIFDEPTRGIDIIGRREVYRIMQELLTEGTSIIMFTSDYAEAMEMSHRVMVMRRGKIVKEFPRNSASEDDILKAAIGVGEFR